ncbi:AfsA-related hotdog domain-containing protein [Actinacidiphila acidipaludis]|uniref:A-factor biosynthesis hotdog domain-containing protein n=1 Tax=Actinacidiphila acidipaludis TaxID=2873382 RepID=A0ABS7QE43_9ACTN|nr:AfsA-related hotdog domain-containing protein [Streptomyces acidipaludis]MBY8881441.1 hypothetical protein [Streptomyces acidipaludis]
MSVQVQEISRRTSPGLAFDQTVPKKLVHKHALDQVFVTGWEELPDRTLVAAVLPRAHGLYCEYPVEDRLPDIALITEVCRQACFLVAHTRFDVPFADNRYQFLLQELETRLADPELLPPARPVELVAECTIEETRRRGGELTALVWRFRVSDRSGEVHVADARMRMVWIDRGDWRRMRDSMRRGRRLSVAEGGRRLAPGTVTARSVGRRNQDNVALQTVTQDEQGFHAEVRADLQHPVLFDHPIDHIYAMVQLEATRQLAVSAHARTRDLPAAELELASCAARFVSVAEFDLPLRLDLPRPVGTGDRSGELEHAVRLSQGDRLVSEFRLTTRPRRVYPERPAAGH